MLGRFFEFTAVVLWFLVVVNEVFLSLWGDNELVLWSALLFTLWALLYEMRDGKLPP